MMLWLQHLLALGIVALAASYVVYQAASAMRGKRSKLGSCCAKGCTPQTIKDPKSERIVFLPVELLKKRK
jgi:hypothetical protein